MGKRNWLSFENALVIIAFLLGLGLRFYNLSVFPLSDSEAARALQALHLSRGGAFDTSLQPLYIIGTGLLFTILGSSNIWARFLPALMGSLLVLAPLFLRTKLGRSAMLIMVFGLAIDPGLVITSRQIDSPIIAVALFVFSLGFFFHRRFIFAGIAIGLLLLTGSGAIQAALIFLVILLAARLFHLPSIVEIQPSDRPMNSKSWLYFGVAITSTAFVASTFFLKYQSGFASWAESLLLFFYNFFPVVRTSPLQAILALIIYQPLALIFAVIAALRRWKTNSTFVPYLVIWIFAGLLLVILYPARQVSDIAWVLFPLWGLASLELRDIKFSSSEQTRISFGLGALIILVFPLIWLNAAGFVQGTFDSQEMLLRLAVLIGLFALLILSVVLVGFGWSWMAARTGAILGLGVVLVIYLFASITAAAYMNPYRQRELWTKSPSVGDADLILSTVADISEWNTGLRDHIDITIKIESPAMHWLLREFPVIGQRDGYTNPLGSSPSLILTQADQSQPQLAASYRGQDFVWWVTPDWGNLASVNFFGWLTSRTVPMSYENIILWGRGDLFPGGSDVGDGSGLNSAELIDIENELTE
ncbi:MAG: hypothetical protein KAT29_07205 [Anaerolineales bacterium]|nr:hypothetical protein [Anaerolineales bacterium]